MPPTNSRPADLEAQVADLARQVAELRAGSISSAAGSVRLPPGASLTVVDDDGSVLGYIGALNHVLPDGRKETGVIFRRQDGGNALTIAYDGNNVDEYRQVVSISDNNGAQVFGDDGASGVGLSRPYLPINLVRAQYLDLPRVAVTAWTDVEVASFYKQHPKALARILATTDASDTTGEVRVLIDDVQVGASDGVGFAVGWRTIGPFAVPGSFLSSHDIKIQARRLTGTGGVRVASHAVGVQS